MFKKSSRSFETVQKSAFVCERHTKDIINQFCFCLRVGRGGWLVHSMVER
jgi:hypothetical protein